MLEGGRGGVWCWGRCWAGQAWLSRVCISQLHQSFCSSTHLPAFLPACRGTWREETFKEYNFNALGLPPAGGHLHPLLKVRSRGAGQQAVPRQQQTAQEGMLPVCSPSLRKTVGVLPKPAVPARIPTCPHTHTHAHAHTQSINQSLSSCLSH
jgi:hypothetical protein